MQNVTVTCDDFDSFKTFNVSEFVVCGTSCGVCGDYTCDEWWENSDIACSELEDRCVLMHARKQAGRALTPPTRFCTCALPLSMKVVDL